MMNGNHVYVNRIIGICLISLIGCGSQEPEAKQIPEIPSVSGFGTDNQDFTQVEPTGSVAEQDSAGNLPQEDNQSGWGDISEETGHEETDPEGTDHEETGHEDPFHVPALPDTGSGLTDFVPEGWTLWDSVELDFNEDGIPDYVGVLDTVLPDMEDGTRPDFMPPRILFAIASDGAGRYRLDFQDINLIRTREEGGIFGDPYEPLTAEGTSFTTHAYGGSAWKWSEADTYTYNEGVWYKTMSESTYGYGSLVTSYRKDNWESGIGIRKERSDDFGEMEKYWDSEDSWAEEFDLEYEVTLDAPPTLYQAGMRWWLAPNRVTEWKVDSIEFAEGISLSADRVKRPGEAYLDYCDEDCVLYIFQDKDSSLYYITLYRFQDRKLAVLAESDTVIDSAMIYKDKIYYSTEIVEEIVYQQTQGEEGQVVKEKDTVGLSLNRMALDGSDKENVFAYRYPGTEQEILESRLPYLSLGYEISGDEIIAEVYVGSEPHPVYRMGSDGSGLRQIGQIPAE